MPQMTDPHVAMVSFQEKVRAGRIKPQRGALDKGIYVFNDRPGDGSEPRMTYVTLEGKTVTAFAVFGFATCGRIDGDPCMAIGYAVPGEYRKQGRAKKIAESAIQEMKHGLARHGHKVFWVEAIIDEDNIASQRVAEKVISDQPTKMIDDISKKPALRYLRKVEI